MNVTFIIWYNNTTPQIVDVIKSILPSIGPTKISIVAVKTSVGRQLEDSAVRWTPRCRIVYAPGSSKKLAWEHGINSIIASGEIQKSDYVVLCDPFFLAKTNIFNEDYYQHNYRFYLPYSDQYGEKSAEKTNRLIKTNGGGSMIMLSRQACYNFKSLPQWLNEYCIDFYLIDQLAMFGYTGHKMPGCYVESIKFNATDKQRRSMADDVVCYDAWLAGKQNKGYNKILKANLESSNLDKYFCSEENCD